MNKTADLGAVLIQKQYGYLLGKTFLKKGSSPDLFPKTFSPNFAPMGCSLDTKK